MQQESLPGPADVEYFTQAQAGAWGDTLQAFLRFCEIPPGSRVLDVGAGPGLLPRLCQAQGARSTVSCDSSWPMSTRAAQLGRAVAGLTPLTGSVLGLPLAVGVFDAVLATNLLFLLPDPAVSLAEMARVCAGGGMVAFLNPSDAMSVAAAGRFADERGLAGFTRFSLLNYARLAEEHLRLSPAAWEALATAAGLQDVRTKPFAGGLEIFVRGRKAPARVSQPSPKGLLL